MMHKRIFRSGILLATAVLIGLSACTSDPKPQKNNNLSDKVELNWTWKRTVNKSSNVVYGTVKNKTDKPMNKVELEFRTQDADGKTIQTHTFGIENLAANEQKPFTQDYPARATQEDSGFVTLKKIIPAN